MTNFAELIERAAVDESRRRRALAPDLSEVLRRACMSSTALWQRRTGDVDFGWLAVGIGAVRWSPPLVEINAVRDPAVAAVLGDRTGLRDVPITVNVGHGVVIGIAGAREGALGLARSLVMQAAVHHGPADMTMAVFAEHAVVADWEWAKWLPHVRGRDATRRLVTTDADAHALVDALRADAAAPLLLAVADSASFVGDRHSPVRRLLAGGVQPTAAVVLAERADRLPSCCSVVIELDEAGSARCSGVGGEVVGAMTIAGLASDLARRGALWLTRFEDPERAVSADGAPSSVSLFELLDLPGADADCIARRWQEADARSLAVPIGLGATGPVVLDLVADGPHMLLAGTTGSGKSELLRSLVCALTTSFDPEHLSLVLVDFKGGSAFGGCASLPHTAGVVTDLDEHLGSRVLRSLHAELRRRERRLRDAGVACIEDYFAGGYDRAEPLPRLVVVIDEFAALAVDVPEFIDSLIGVAQRGRSLGVHLVLATQRPSGSISPAVRANTSIRVALRVEDDGDSVDVLGCADAARIDRRTPGRGYARFGPGAVLPFQTALTAVVPVSSQAAGPVQEFRFEPGRPPVALARAGGDGLGGLVAAVAEAARIRGSRLAPPPWRPPLPDRMQLNGVWDDDTDCCVIGLIDDPDNQRQVAYEWAPQTGNLLFYGAAGSGASTALRTTALALTRRWSSSELYLYGLDFGTGSLSSVGELPHVGSIVAAGDRERQERLIRTLRQELECRRADRGAAARPIVVLLIENYGAFHAAFDDLAGLAWREELTRVVADGPAVGLFTFACADRPGAVPLAIADLIANKLIFRLADATDVTLFGLRPRTGRPLPPGRAVDVTSGLEVQLALPPEHAESDGGGDHGSAPPVDVLPQTIRLNDVEQDATFEDDHWSVTIGLADSDLRPCGLHLGDGDVALVAGPPRSGRSTVLANVALLVSRHAPVVAVTAVTVRRSPLRAAPVDRVVTTASDLAAVLDDLEAATTPQLLLIDDAEMVDDPGGRLTQILGARHPHLRVVVAGRADALRSGYGHWTSVVRRARAGVVLRPQVDVDGELWQTALPRRAATSFPVGRGYLLTENGFELVQCAAPTEGMA